MPKRPRVLGQRSVRPSRRKEYDAARRRRQPWRAWYSLAVWRRIKARQLAEQPLCERHLARSPSEVVPATVCNHRIPHRGDWALFVAGPFESLCKPCHDSEVQREERGAVGG